MIRSFFDFFPTPKFLEMPAPGLSLSDNGIRFIELSRHKREFSLKRYDFVPFSTPLIVSGVIQDAEKLTKELGAFREKHDLHYIRTSLPEERAYLFSTEISPMQSEHLKTAIEFSIEENVPLSVAEAVFDYTKIPKKTKNEVGGTRVSVSVFPTSVVTEYLNVFRGAGFEPMHFEVESQAIAKAVVKRGENRTSVILHVGFEKIGIYICEGQAVVFTSTISITPFAFEKNSEENSGSEKESRAMKEIVDALKKIFLYWQTQAERTGDKEKLFEKVILVGKEASRIGLSQAISQGVNMPVEYGNVWQNAFSLDSYIPDIPKEESIKYATAVGLALTHPIS